MKISADPNSSAQAADHTRHQLVDGGIALDLEEPRHADGSDLGDAPDVIAKKVDNHQVLGSILGIERQGGRDGRVACGILVARGRALHRPGLDAPWSVESEEEFRRTGEQEDVPECDLGGEPDRLACGKGGDYGARSTLPAPVERESQVGLVDVAGPDVVGDATEGGRISAPIPPRMERADAAAG